MSEKEHSLSVEKQPPSSSYLATTFLDSFKILLREKFVFLFLFIFLTLPLSILHFCLSFSSIPLKDHIYRLEFLATIVQTRFEARQVWKESREEAISLLHIRSRFFIPLFCLSLLATITLITSTFISYQGKKPSFSLVLASIKSTWKRVAITSILIYALLLSYSMIPLFLSIVLNFGPKLRVLVMIMGFGLEVYIMAVTVLGLVVSVLEERHSWDAICVGAVLMKGRRMSGLALSGILVFLSGFIGHMMERTIKGQDPSQLLWVAVIGSWKRVGLVCLYGAQILWGYVVTTVFYCECRRRHVSRGEDDGVLDC